MLLTKEQLEALNKDFARFLASQQIDMKEWRDIKENKPQIAQEELELFSDLVWDDVLSKTKYIEHFSTKQLDLFNCGPTNMHRIVIKINKQDFDLFKKEDYQWFLSHLNHKSLSYFQAQKKYQKNRNIELFDLVKKGGIIGNGHLYKNMLIQIK